MANWISVHDARPSLGKYCLVVRVTPRGLTRPFVAEPSQDLNVWHTEDGDDITDISHWMPLPAPPVTES